MEALLKPEPGLMIWTWITFVLLVLVLSATAWKPIIAGIKNREDKIRTDLDGARKAQADAERLRQQYEQQLAEAQRSIQEMVTQARKDGERTKAELVAAAKGEAERVLEKGRKDLEGETERLRGALRGEVAELSVALAEKILNRTVDKKVQDDVLKESLKTLGGVQR